jgi:hypothetical protein
MVEAGRYIIWTVYLCQIAPLNSFDFRKVEKEGCVFGVYGGFMIRVLYSWRYSRCAAS